MLGFLLRLFFVVIVATLVIFLYYADGLREVTWDAIARSWDIAGIPVYIFGVSLAYLAYKIILVVFNAKTIILRPIYPGLLLIAQVLVVCILYFTVLEEAGMPGSVAGNALTLFASIIGYLVLPLGLGLLWWALGMRVARILGLAQSMQQNSGLCTLLPLGLGLAKFASIMAVLGFFGLYTVWTLLLTVWVFAIISHKELRQAVASLWTYAVEYRAHRGGRDWMENLNLPLITLEFSLFVITLVLAVNFLSIVRPLPIGWDDLGVYMNYPRLMATQGFILPGMGLASWQTVTGIGYLAGSATQAFFLNNLGGILAAIGVWTAISGLLMRRATFLHLPSIMTAIVIATPMIIFQQAKDMKLDPALLFVSITALYTAIWYVRERVIPGMQSGAFRFFTRENILWMMIIGVLTGFAFTIKLTAVMLLLWLVSVFAGAVFGVVGFLSFFAFLIASFTGLWLWEFLKVVIPETWGVSLGVITMVFSALAILGYAIIIVWWWDRKFLGAVGWIAVFFAGCVWVVAPWLVFHAVHFENAPTIQTLISGESPRFKPDFEAIYTPEELSERQSRYERVIAADREGQTTNEDFWRYLGYEPGINNYLKLPYNMTMQTNQSGAFTQIGYWYLAFFPGILLFLPQRWWFSLLIVSSTLAYLAYTAAPPIADAIASAVRQGTIGSHSITASVWDALQHTRGMTEFFSGWMLPEGYGILLGILIAFTLALRYGTRQVHEGSSREWRTLWALALFWSVYAFLYGLSGHGIPWYGIMLYFILLSYIAVAASHMSRIDEHESGKSRYVRFFASGIFMMIVGIFFIRTGIPEAFESLHERGYELYRSGRQTANESIFSSQPKYLPILAHLNISDRDALFDRVMQTVKAPLLRHTLEENLAETRNFQTLEIILRSILAADITRIADISPVEATSIRNDAQDTLEALYDLVLFPPEDIRETGPIYRIGTFLTYFIDDNPRRYYEDSLVRRFDVFFAHDDPDTTIEHMSDAGFGFLLVDLNAATIDKDPRRDLTRRFEGLILAFQSDRLQLIATDSPCLELALAQKNILTRDEFITLAHVNSESYMQTDAGLSRIHRSQKLSACRGYIAELARTNALPTDASRSFDWLSSAIERSPSMSDQQLSKLIAQNVGHGWTALFRVLPDRPVQSAIEESAPPSGSAPEMDG